MLAAQSWVGIAEDEMGYAMLLAMHVCQTRTHAYTCVMDLRGPGRSAVWAECVGLAFCHLFLYNLYFRSFLSPSSPANSLPCLSQIVLAFGNYMNSSKRGAAYGFRLQSLDAVRGAKKNPLAWGLVDSWWPVAYNRSSCSCWR